MGDKKDLAGKIPMRELTKLTTMSRATINFYIKEGILPPPEKSAKNMAYYDVDFIEKLNLIEKMREAKFTLNQIKLLISSDTVTINDLCLQLLEGVNKLLPFNRDDPPVTVQQLQEIGFDSERITILIDMNMIIPLDKANSLFPPLYLNRL